MSIFARRRDQLRQVLQEKSLDALLVTDEANVTYLTGFTGDSSFLIVQRKGGEVLLSDRRYTQQLEEECPGLELAIRGPGSKQSDLTIEVANKLNFSSLGVESDVMSIGFFEKLREGLKGKSLSLTSMLVDTLREIKDETEIAQIREAVTIAERAFAVIRASLRHGRTEKEVADELEYQIRLFGGVCGSFPSIIGVGPRAALPHGRPARDSRIGDFPFVLIDWGARGRLYNSDLTRVLATGTLSPKLEEVYGVVLAAQLAAIQAIRPGAILKDVDAAARNTIAQAGYGDFFGHGLGHGIGLRVHEQPRLGPDQDRPLLAGMVVTVEPGIYLPGWGGVRIEDDILVTPDGHEVLTSVPKNIEDITVN